MTISWAEAYQPVVWNFFMAGYSMVETVIPALYNVKESTSAREYFLGLEGTDREGWEVYKNTGITAYADFDKGFEKTFKHYNYTRRFKLLQDYIEDGELNNAAQQALSGMGLSAAQVREGHASDVFNGAFAGDLGPDGVYLCSASHPYSTANADVYDNLGTEAFSYTALKTARKNMRGWKDGLGNPMRRNGRLILCSIDLEDVVEEVIGATGKPGTANNDANATTRQRGYSYIAWDELSDSESWFLLDTLWMKQSLFWFNRVPLYSKVVEEATTHVVYEFRMRYSYGFIDPRFVYGNAV
jgi:hypothetical protein